MLASRGQRESKRGGIERADPGELQMLRRQASRVWLYGLLGGVVLTAAVVGVAWVIGDR